MNWATLYAILSKKIDDISALQMKKVTELPETGETNTLYLVPKTTAEEGNYSDEYIWDADLEDFERVGDTLIAPEKDVVIFLASYSAPKSFTLLNGKKGADLLNECSNGKIVKVLASGTGGHTILLDVVSYSITYSYVNLFGIDDNSICFSFKLGPNDIANLDYLECRYILPNYPTGPNGASLVASEIQSGKLEYAYKLSPKYIADAYVNSLSKIYNTGDIVSHNSKIYKCKENNVTGQWNSSKWDDVTVIDIIDSKISDAITSVLNTSY